jgi:hypothetical protein
MDVLIRLIKDVIKILQNIPEEDYEILEILESIVFSELKQELGTWFIADYPLYQGS